MSESPPPNADTLESPESPERMPSPEPPASPDADEPINDAPDSPAGELKDLYEKDVPSSPSSIGQKSPALQDEEEEGVTKSRSASPVDTPKKKAIIDSDDDEEEPSSSKKRALIDSDDESDHEKSQPKKRLIGSDASDDEEDNNQDDKAKTSTLFGEDSDDDEPRQREQSDDEKVDGEQGDDAPKAAESDDDDDVVDRRRGDDDRGFEWDFDVMLREKKAERKRKTKRGGKDGGIDIINDDDGMISHLVERMKAAAKADRNANLDRKPAFQKIKLLPEVKSMMNRAGIVEALIENGFMSAISEWLAPLPDKCLPALDIRITMLKLLHNPRFWKLDRSTLKQSGLGKAVMLLYKHPNETKENKLIANKLIGEWARPIFQLDTDYSSMTREERVVRDYDRMPAIKKKKMSINKPDDEDEDSDDDEKRHPKIKESGGLGPTSSGLLKPGDKGYIPRARVPKPSTRDYVVRPKWNVEGECKDRKATGTRRYDQAFRDFQERTKRTKASRSVTVSLEGRNLQI